MEPGRADCGFIRMVEHLMYAAIGFLLAALLAIMVMPLVHRRAVRLTMARLQSALPQSVAEIQADKDLLRAEFAMGMRRLELALEEARNKCARQMIELGKRNDAINKLKEQREALKVEIITLRAQLKAAASRPAPRSTSQTNVSVVRQWGADGILR